MMALPLAASRALRVLGIDAGTKLIHGAVLAVPASGQATLATGIEWPAEDLAGLVRWIEKRGIDLVALEDPPAMAPFGEPQAIVSRGNCLLSTAKLVHRLAGRLEERGYAVALYSPSDWRKAICPVRKGRGGARNDSDVKAALELHLDALPRCNEHIRDAAGVALAAAHLRQGRATRTTKAKGAKR